MKNGLAIWHYPHRDLIQNIKYFADCGYESLSVHGETMYSVAEDEGLSRELAEVLNKTKIILTVHSALPLDHSEISVSAFRKRIDAYGEWQRRYGLIKILSFDVLEAIRDNVSDYISYALDRIPSCAIAVEDFGLVADEVEQLERFRSNKRFGYLVDVGHMCLRLHGKNASGLRLFSNSPRECEAYSHPGFSHYLKAFHSKDFPIFEIHLHQNDGVEDIHQFLDNGVVDIEAIAQILKEINYEGIVTLECAPGYRFECKYPESDRKIQESFDLWRSYQENL